jgi:hypothetical protein
MLAHERALFAAAGIARIVARVVRGLLIDDAGPEGNESDSKNSSLR